MIRFHEVSKSYDGGRSFAVREMDLRVEQGRMSVLLGESGSGKTTALKMINRLTEPTAGRIEVDGRDVMEQNPVDLRRRIGYIFQGIGLFPHMSVGENIAVVPNLLGWDREWIRDRVAELMELVELDPSQYRDRLPEHLSGGQQQRVGVARALAAEPRIMLMDEPFGALDPITRDALQEAYLRIHNRLGLTSVMVTHDMTEALLMADEIVAMREGCVLQTGSPTELITAARHDYVRELMSKPKEQADRVESLVRAAEQSPA